MSKKAEGPSSAVDIYLMREKIPVGTGHTASLVRRERELPPPSEDDGPPRGMPGAVGRISAFLFMLILTVACSVMMYMGVSYLVNLIAPYFTQ